MTDLWQGLPVPARDVILLLVLLVPAVATGATVLRGYAPGPLVWALLRRFRWTSLTFAVLIAVSVAMGLGLLAQERGLRVGTARAADKFDMIVSAPGSELTMMFATVFLQPSDVPLLSGDIYTEIANHDLVEIAAPLAFGDSYGGSPVVGTTADFVTYLSEGRVEGRLWQSTFEAVAGAAVPLALGASFEPAHGVGEAAEDGAHDGSAYTIVGRLPRSGSPWDKAIMVPVEAVWEVHGLANGHAPGADTRLGPPFDAAYFPGTPAVILRATELWASYALRAQFTRAGESMAFFPGAVLADLYRVMGDLRRAMSLMALVAQGLVAASVLLAMFILTRLMRRHLALLRALGAPARFILAVVWSYAATLLIAGALAGLVLGFGAAMALSAVISARTDVLVSAQLGWSEFHLLAAFVSLASVLSLVPAAMTLRQPPAEGLRA